MLVEFRLERFKSFREARLPLAELTVLIGANASGKSNLIEALRLLSWLAKGRQLSEIFDAVEQRELDVRGPLAKLLYDDCDSLTLGATARVEQAGEVDVALQLKLHESGLRVTNESVRLRHAQIEQILYKAREHERREDHVYFDIGGLTNHKDQVTYIASNQRAIFTQFAPPLQSVTPVSEELPLETKALLQLRRMIESILVLDPVPSRMRGYNPTRARVLGSDGAHLSSVLYDLCERQGRKEDVLAFVRSLPEQDIRDLAFMTDPRGEVMVQLTESFGDKASSYESTLLSDGTLRVLAVAAALLSVPQGTLVVIEEIDNGVHPTRARLLIDNIYRVARERKLRVLLTTHNPALLDALPDEVLPDVVACYRDPKEGDSRLVRLKDLEDYPALVAQGPLGYLLAQGIVERYVRFPKTPEQKEEELRQFLERLRNPEVEP